MNCFLFPGFATAALALSLLPTPARAEIQNCTNITSVPTVITSQGVYCLKQDLNTAIASGNAIVIATNNVTLDCNGFKLGGLAAGAATETLGIAAQQRNNITVRNCNVRGFLAGIALVRNEAAPALPIGNRVEDNRLDGNTMWGIIVEADSAVIRGNVISGTGGTPQIKTVAGIVARGGLDITGNLIDDVAPANPLNAQAIGIYATSAIGGVVSDNRIRNLSSEIGAFGMVALGASEGLSIRNNLFANTTGDLGNGLQCVSDRSVASGNAFLGYEFPFSGCKDGSLNISN